MKDIKKLLSDNEHLLKEHLDADAFNIIFSMKQTDDMDVYNILSHALNNLYGLIINSTSKSEIIDTLYHCIKIQCFDKDFNSLCLFCTKNCIYIFAFSDFAMPKFIINGYTIYYVETNLHSIIVTKNNRIIAAGDIIAGSIKWSSRLTFNLKYYFDLDTPCIDKQLTDVIVSNIILQSMHK